jgi:hypothetical protein
MTLLVWLNSLAGQSAAKLTVSRVWAILALLTDLNDSLENRMWGGLHKLPIWILVLVLGHAPIPWSHSHDSLTPRQLVAHLQDYHPNCPLDKLPRGWHLHCFDLGQADPDDDAAILEIPSSPLERLRSSWCRLACEIVDVSKACEITASAGVNANGRMLVSLPKRELFKQYGAFLI